MSQPDSKSTRPAGILVRKPTTSIYTVLLGSCGRRARDRLLVLAPGDSAVRLAVESTLVAETVDQPIACKLATSATTYDSIRN